MDGTAVEISTGADRVMLRTYLAKKAYQTYLLGRMHGETDLAYACLFKNVFGVDFVRQ